MPVRTAKIGAAKASAARPSAVNRVHQPFLGRPHHYCDCPMDPAKCRRGLSLVDLVISVLLMGILTATAAPRFAAVLERYRAQAAAERIQADLNLAREAAVSSSATVTIKFAPSTDNYNIPDLAHLDASGETYVVELTGAPYWARLNGADLGGDLILLFNRFGAPDSGGTITVQSGSAVQTVTVDPDTGRGSIP